MQGSQVNAGYLPISSGPNATDMLWSVSVALTRDTGQISMALAQFLYSMMNLGGTVPRDMSIN